MTGKELKNKLELTGIPFRQVADALGISEQNLQNKMSSADIKVSFLCKISKVLHKSIYFFLDGQDFYDEKVFSDQDFINKKSDQFNIPDLVSDNSFTYRLYKDLESKADQLLKENVLLKEKVRQLEAGAGSTEKHVPCVTSENKLCKGSGVHSTTTASSGRPKGGIKSL